MKYLLVVLLLVTGCASNLTEVEKEARAERNLFKKFQREYKVALVRDACENAGKVMICKVRGASRIKVTRYAEDCGCVEKQDIARVIK